jgi:hypothetical protein
VLAQLGDEGGGCLASPRLGISHGGGGAGRS